MKTIVTIITTAVLSTLAWLLLSLQWGGSCWYGHCKISEGYPLVTFISVGDHVYHDKNFDHKPQQNELVPNSGTLKIHSVDGKSSLTLRGVSSAIIPEAVSDDYPQLVDVEIQSPEFPEIRQSGVIVMARDPDKAGTCHLLGPLSIIMLSRDAEFCPGKDTDLKISIGTVQSNSNEIAPAVGYSAALVHTSVPDNRSECAFDESLRPRMEIAFGNDPDKVETIVFDGFC